VRALRGAVQDATSVKDYLESDLQVPSEQIQILLNKDASRSAIITGLLRLQDDPRIAPGDPILIFFAGHGSELPQKTSPVEPHTHNEKIQVIIPQNYCPGLDEEASGETKVEAIPDRTFAALLDGIANSKGDNIVSLYREIFLFFNLSLADRL